MTATFIAYTPTVAPTVSGIGATEEQALADAKEWTEESDGMVAVPASQALYDYVNENGDDGDVVWTIQDGVAYLDSEIGE